ncbi:acid protease [Athelia psychrophila]|uniref:Acid protease n=1 Tax=Athelia psychrophila TaxID=1759441 RepID=A0A167UR99_9AGAM|nr:acid protease [Fibularhizoctonia sp. CBS 109695]
MVNFKALSTSVVLSFAFAVLGSPVAREERTFLTHPITRKSSSSIPKILEKDIGRIANFNGDAQATVYSGAVTNEEDSYLAAVTIGTQVFSLIVDTGSANIWVGANTKLTGCISTGHPVTVSYGSGSFSGTECIDSVSFAGATVAKQSIGDATTTSGFSGVDGIFGFGPAILTEDTVSGVVVVPTFLDNLKTQGSIATEVLGVYYAPESGSDDDDANGELTLGGVDPTKYTGSIVYAPKTTTGATADYWGVVVSAITYGTTSLGSGSAIVDTGTTLIYIPTTAYTKFLTASGGKTDSSTGLAMYTKQPTSNFSFAIGGAVLTLTPAQYLVPAAQYSAFGLTGSDYYSWINDGGSSGVDMIIGQKFIENYYTVFDTTNSRIGFATRA